MLNSCCSDNYLNRKMKNTLKEFLVYGFVALGLLLLFKGILLNSYVLGALFLIVGVAYLLKMKNT